MPVTKRLYPHELSTELSLRPSAPFDPTDESLDLGFLIREDESDQDLQTLDLTNSALPWQHLQIDLQGVLPAVDLSRILPLPSIASEDAALIVSVVCSETRLRRAVQLAFEGGSWTGSVTILRDEARGAVRLVPRLVRTTDIPTSEGSEFPFATRSGFVIAEGRSLNIRIDPPNIDTEGVLKISWENFPKSQNSWMRSHDGDICYLEESESRPTLYLNSHYAELKAALHSKSRSGSTAVVRHMGNALIAQAVWTQLFSNAAARVDPETEESELELTGGGWRNQLLRDLLQRAFPGLGLEEQVRRMGGLRADTGSGVLNAVISSAAQNASKTALLIKRASRAVNVKTQELER
jgi:hypothetical protein